MKGFISYIFIFFILGMMFASQTLYNSHQEENISINIYNYTENKLIWNTTHWNNKIKNISSVPENETLITRSSNIIYKSVDCFGYVLFEIAKANIEYGYTNPQQDFEFMFKFVYYTIIIIIVLSVFPSLLPIIAILYIFFECIKQSYYWIKNRRGNR